ncbi:Thermostable beta-glucosidase B [compost metagenome]
MIQLYAKHLDSKVDRPEKELKAFQRVFFKAGETKDVLLTVRAKDLQYWNVTKQQFELEINTIELQIGSASDAILLSKKINVK